LDLENVALGALAEDIDPDMRSFACALPSPTIIAVLEVKISQLDTA
jgi:hypothetical protein